MTGFIERDYQVDGYTIHIKEKGAGKPVVFIHGSGPGASGASNFRDNIDAFVAAGHRVILPDLIGYGAYRSPRASTIRSGCSPTPSMARFASTGSNARR